MLVSLLLVQYSTLFVVDEAVKFIAVIDFPVVAVFPAFIVITIVMVATEIKVIAVLVVTSIVVSRKHLTVDTVALFSVLRQGSEEVNHDFGSTNKMVELIQSYPELCASIDRVANKPIDRDVSIPADDLPVCGDDAPAIYSGV